MPISLITGATRGIGREIATQLAASGHHVLVGARDAAVGESVARDLRAAGAVAEVLALDVNRTDSIVAAASSVAASHVHIDILINNAAVNLDHYGGPETTMPEQLSETLGTNVVAVHSLIRAFLPLLRKSDAARIINVSSGAGQLSDMYGSNYAPAYQVSKAALNALTLVWATALSEHGIPVNAVCPGWCRTDMGGAGAPRSAKEGADGIVWLATEASRELTGGFYRDRKRLEW